MAAAIDMKALRASAFEGEGPTAVVDRTWLQSVYRALCGEDYVDTSLSPEIERQLNILSAVDASIERRRP